MIQKEKLVQFYFSQYKDSALKLKKKNNDGKKTYEQRIGRLADEMKHMKAGRMTQPHLEEYHRQIDVYKRQVWESVNSFALIKAAEAGLGITVLPEKLLQDSLLLKKLRVLAVEETEMENRMFALYHKDRYVPKTVRTMLAEIAGRKE